MGTSKKPQQNPPPQNPTLQTHPQPPPPPTTTPPPPMLIAGAEEDAILAASAILTREELIRRRLRRIKQLETIYKDHYWALMEDVKASHRDFVWKFGKSPYKEEGGEKVEGEVGSGSGGGGGDDDELVMKKCEFNTCRTKAMALAKYCHTHILADPDQTLYTACSFAIKSAHTGPVRCAKPILCTTTPPLCANHYQKAQKHLQRALKKAGHPNPSANKPVKLHVLIASAVNQINAKRRELRAKAGTIAGANAGTIMVKQDNVS